MKKIIAIIAAIAILFGAGLTVEKTKDEARIPVGGGHELDKIAYIPVGGTSFDTVAYVPDEEATVASIPVGGT